MSQACSLGLRCDVSLFCDLRRSGVVLVDGLRRNMVQGKNRYNGEHWDRNQKMRQPSEEHRQVSAFPFHRSGLATLANDRTSRSHQHERSLRMEFVMWLR